MLNFVSFVMYISGAKFEECCSNISGVILDSVFYCLSGAIYDIITFLICIMLQYGHNRLFIDIDMIHVTFDHSMIGITYILNTLDSSLNV